MDNEFQKWLTDIDSMEYYIETPEIQAEMREDFEHQKLRESAKGISDKGEFFEWIFNYPDMAQKYYPYAFKIMERVSINMAPEKTAMIITNIPTFFSKWKENSNKHSGKVKLGAIKSYISIIDLILNINSAGEIEQEAVERARPLLMEQKGIWEQEMMKIYDESISPFFHSLRQVCLKLQGDKTYWTNKEANGSGAKENDRNKVVANMLSMNYDVLEQLPLGKSAKGIDRGELDIVVRDKGVVKYIIEALNLKKIATNTEKKNLITHIQKLENNYDPQGLAEKYLLVYCEVQNGEFNTLDKKYLNFIENHSFEWEKMAIENIPVDTTNMRVYETFHQREGKPVKLYHFLVKMTFD